MRINHNIAALNTYNKLNSATNAQSKSMEKLSSGLRINSASDDAAGLAISEKMRGQIRGLDQAAKNAQDGISLIQTAEGALSETTDILQRMRELATQASNDTNTTTDRDEIQKEINSLTSEINRIGNTTEFNTQKLLNGSKDSANSIAVGDELTPAKAATLTVGDLTLTAKDSGVAGNDLSIEILEGVGTSTAASISVADGKITITTGTDADDAVVALTADDIKSLIDGDDDAKALVNVTVAEGKGATAQAAKAETSLANGADAVLADADDVVTYTGLQFQIGANENQSMTLEISDMRAKALGLTGAGEGFTSETNVSNGTDSTGVESGLDVTSAASASKAITTIQNAIDKVSAERSKLGANQNRLDHTINNLSTSSENLTAAESRIRDVDYALAA